MGILLLRSPCASIYLRTLGVALEVRETFAWGLLGHGGLGGLPCHVTPGGPEAWIAQPPEPRVSRQVPQGARPPCATALFCQAYNTGDGIRGPDLLSSCQVRPSLLRPKEWKRALRTSRLLLFEQNLELWHTSCLFRVVERDGVQTRTRTFQHRLLQRLAI
jgi:hypothetical protein